MLVSKFSLFSASDIKDFLPLSSEAEESTTYSESL